MKHTKIKSSDGPTELSAMKNQLSAVIKEMSALSGRIEDLEQQTLTGGHSCSFTYDQRLHDLKARLQPGKDPAKPVIFLTRLVLECLSKGPMSEKDIKTIVLDRCKELGIKSSNRGLIAGTGMDVATVCCVLAALGALEQVDASTVACAPTGVKSETADASTHPGSDRDMSLGGSCPETITGPGAELYALLSERWSARLTEYFEEALKSKQAAANESANSVVSAGRAASAPCTASGPAVAASLPPASAPVVGSGVPMAAPRPAPSASVAPAMPSTGVGGASAPGLLQRPAQPVPGPGPLPAASATAPPPPTAAPVAYYPIFNNVLNARASAVTSATGQSTALQSAPQGSGAPATSITTGSAGSMRALPMGQPVAQGQVPVRVPSLAPQEQRAVAALGMLEGPSPGSNTGVSSSGGGGSAPSAIPASSATAPYSIAPGAARPTGIAEAPMSAAGGMRPAVSAGSLGNPLPVAPNNFLSASAAAAPVPYNSLPASGHTAGPQGEVTYTSILSASGTSISIPAPTALEANSKTGKTKAPKVPKAPGEKKPVKRPISKGSELANAMAAAAAAQAGSSGTASTGAGAASGGGSTAIAPAKPRKGPTALRVWRIREQFVPFVRDLLTGHGAASASHSAHGTSSSSVTGSAQVKATAPLAPDSNHTTTSTSHSTINSSGSSASNLAMQLLLHPERIQTAARADYALQSAQEIEERILRRLAGQCNIALKTERYRVGTTYLSSDPDIMTRVIGSRFVRNSAQLPAYYAKSSAKYSGTSDTHSEEQSAEPSFALYDEGVSITGAYLLDKVRRTKRQRGECLYGSISLPYNSTASASVTAARTAAAASVGVYSGAHVHALGAVCNKTMEYYWAASGGSGSPRSAPKAKKAPVSASKGQNEPITMAQYAHHLHMGIGGAPVVLSSCSNGSSITTHTLRRYAQPLSLSGSSLPMLDPSKSATIFAAATGGAHSASSSGRTNFATSNNGSEVLRIPDLSLCTREIAWSEIAQEFSVLPAPVDEPGHIPGSSSTVVLSSAVDTPQDATAPKPAEKKRKYLQNHGKGAPAPPAGTLEDAAQKLASIEVLAPQYKEVVPVSQIVMQLKANAAKNGSASGLVDDGSDSEDTSDEAVSARHEAVLKSMRDKWNLLQQLKNEAAFGIGGPVPPEGELARPGGSYRGGGYGYFGGRSASGIFASAATLPCGPGAGVGLGAEGAEAGLLSLQQVGSPGALGRFQNLSPRKRGLASAHAKRRGRPPKIAKLSHHLQAQHAAALAAHPAHGHSSSAGTGAGASSSNNGSHSSGASGANGTASETMET